MYAFGIVLYELLTHRAPWNNDTPQAIYEKVHTSIMTHPHRPHHCPHHRPHHGFCAGFPRREARDRP